MQRADSLVRLLELFQEMYVEAFRSECFLGCQILIFILALKSEERTYRVHCFFRLLDTNHIGDDLLSA